MKKIIFVNLILTASIIACNNNKTDNTAATTTDSSTTVKDSTPAPADTAAANNANKDVDFVMAAADGGMTEVKLSQLAKTNGSAAAVKSLADMMIADHTKANNELKSIAGKNNISVPETLSADKQKAYDDMATKKGADFDKAYMDKMEKDHTDAIELFQREANSGMNPDLKTFATNTLPTLNHHMDMVNTTKKGMK